MAGINSTVRITDGMSPALKSMNKALNIVLNSFEKLQNASAEAIDVSDIRDARAELVNVSTVIGKLEDDLSKATEEQERMKDEARQTSNVMGGLVRKVAGLVATYASFQTLLGLVNLSDTQTQTESRMNLIVDTESGETLEELQQKIFNSANRSRALYTETADVVAALAQRAGDAFNNNNDEVIAFAETLNKMYVIAGASAAEQSSSMLQLTQALGSGVLRGEEFNAVFEAAPNIMQAVADYMGVPIGQLRNMAAEGQITANIVKNAIFNAADEVNKDFEGMNMTWKQVMNKAKNYGIKALEPVLDKINELANNEDIQAFAVSAAVALGKVAMFLLNIFETMSGVAIFVYENWSWIAPIIYTVAAALGMYYGIVLALKIAEYASAAAKVAMAIASYAVATATGAQASATAVATAAQYGLNTAILACPAFWILLVIVAIIAAFYLLAGVISTVSGVFISGLGLILAAIYTSVALVWNVFVGLYNSLVTIFASVMNMFIAVAEFFANCWSDPLGSTVRLFVAWANQILGIVKAIAEAIDALFGSSLAEGVQGWMDGLEELAESKFGEGKYQFERFNDEDTQLERIAYGDAFDVGMDFGNEISEWVGEKLDFGKSIEEIKSELGIDELESASGMTPESYLSDIADNTGAIADSMELTDEDLKYLRDIAEQEAVNRFTTAEIKIDMQNNNSISSGMDIDGIVSQLEDKLYESMEIAAEGVH